MPALRALRHACPDHEIVLAAPSVLAPLVRLVNAVDRLLPAERLEPLDWAGPRPDLAVNLHGRGPQSHRLLGETRPRRLVAFGCVEAGVDGPQWTADEHEAARWCRLVGESLAVEADPRDIILPVPDRAAAVAGAVVVHPGAAFPSRRWPPDRFAEVARWADGQGWPVVITGSPTEADLAEEVRRRARLPRGTVLAGRTNLEELAAVVAAARVVVCGDTGIAHVATAFRTPSVVLFGPVSPRLWGPPADGPHVALWRGTGDGDPWGEQVDPALLEIEVDEVLQRLRAMTRRAPAPA